MVTLRFDSKSPKVEKIGNVIVHRIGFSKPSPTIGDLQKFPLFLNKYWYQFAAAFAALRLHRRYRFDGMWAMMAHSCGCLRASQDAHSEVKYLSRSKRAILRTYRAARAALWPSSSAASRRLSAPVHLDSFSHGAAGWVSRSCRGDTERGGYEAFLARIFRSGYRRDAREARQETGDIFLITTSRLVHKNGIDDVIRALTLLPEHIHFLIYGIGPDEAKLRKLADDLGVASRTHFAGQIGHTELPLALKACDIFIRPRVRSMGNSFIEAMAQSCRHRDAGGRHRRFPLRCEAQSG